MRLEEPPCILDEEARSNEASEGTVRKQVHCETLVYRVEDVAQMLAISQKAAYNLCHTTKEFRVLHIGGSIRVSKASFDRWIACAGS